MDKNPITGLRPGIIIALGNQKGGVGKTTNTVHIARALAEKGRKVLIIDLDMNHGATQHFGFKNPEFYLGANELLLAAEPAKNIIFSVQEVDPDTGEIVVELPQNIDLIPASRRLEGIDKALEQKSKFATPKDALSVPLQEIKSEYDYILLDTAPNATLPTLAAYMCADYFILSAIPDPFAIAGLADALKDLQDAQSRGNPNLSLLGVILSGVDTRTSLANSLAHYVDEAFSTGQGSGKFSTNIARSTVIPQSQKVGKTLFETAPTHKVTDQYRHLASEVEERIKLAEIQNSRSVVNG